MLGMFAPIFGGFICLSGKNAMFKMFFIFSSNLDHTNYRIQLANENTNCKYHKKLMPYNIFFKKKKIIFHRLISGLKSLVSIYLSI